MYICYLILLYSLSFFYKNAPTPFENRQVFLNNKKIAYLWNSHFQSIDLDRYIFGFRGQSLHVLNNLVSIVWPHDQLWHKLDLSILDDKHKILRHKIHDPNNLGLDNQLKNILRKKISKKLTRLNKLKFSELMMVFFVSFC